MTWFDLTVLGVVALSVAFAAIRGAVREVGTLAALAGAAGIAWVLLNPLQSVFGAAESFLATVAIAGATGVLAFVLLYGALHLLLARLPLPEQTRRIDRVAGGVFGLARGLVLVGLGFLAYSYYLGEDRRHDAVKRALTLPVASAMADFFESFAPESARLSPEPAGAVAPSNAAAEGYGRADRAGLSEIMTTVTTSDRPAQESQDANADEDPIAELLQESEPE